MSSTTRFPNGVINVGEDSMLADMGQLDPSKFFTFWEDFNYYNANDWSVSAPSPNDVALVDEDFGVLRFNDASGTAGFCGIFKPNKFVTLVQGKKLWAQARLRVDDSSLSSWSFGLLGNGSGQVVRINSELPAGSTPGYIKVTVAANGGTDIDTYQSLPESDEFFTVGFVFDGQQSVAFYLNGAKIAEASFTQGLLANPFGMGITMVFTTDSQPHYGDVDYFLIARER